MHKAIKKSTRKKTPGCGRFQNVLQHLIGVYRSDTKGFGKDLLAACTPAERDAMSVSCGNEATQRNRAVIVLRVLARVRPDIKGHKDHIAALDRVIPWLLEGRDDAVYEAMIERIRVGLMHPDSVRSLVALDTCTICIGDTPRAVAVSCTHGHRLCKQCLERAIDADHGPGTNTDGKGIKCPGRDGPLRCSCCFAAHTVYRHVSDEHAKKLQQSMMDRAVAQEAARPAPRAITFSDLARIRLDEAACLTTRCCGQVMFDFDACMAITCNCGKHFCGLCLQYNDNGVDFDNTQCHTHVRRCAANPGQPYFTTGEKSVFATKLQIEEAQLNLRIASVTAASFAMATEIRKVAAALPAMKAALLVEMMPPKVVEPEVVVL